MILKKGTVLNIRKKFDQGFRTWSSGRVEKKDDAVILNEQMTRLKTIKLPFDIDVAKWTSIEMYGWNWRPWMFDNINDNLLSTVLTTE